MFRAQQKRLSHLETTPNITWQAFSMQAMEEYFTSSDRAKNSSLFIAMLGVVAQISA